MRGRKRSNRLVAATTEKRGQAKSPTEIAGRVGDQNQRQGRCRKLANTLELRMQHSLGKWPSFLEELNGEPGPTMEDLYSVRTLEPFEDVHLEVSGLLESCFIHFLSCNDV